MRAAGFVVGLAIWSAGCRVSESDYPGCQDKAGPGCSGRIAAGFAHSCALDRNQRVRCWGWNQYHQTDVPDDRFLEVTAGENHTCGLTVDHHVKCWGDNTLGQAGSSEGVESNQVSAGAHHTCELQADSTAFCWGAGALDAAGVCMDPEWDCGQTAQSFSGAKQVTAGWRHTCALNLGGVPACWPAGEPRTTPPAGVVFDQVVAGTWHTCGLTPEGQIQCWGDDEDGIVSFAPTGVFRSLATNVAMTAGVNCAIRDDGAIVCWGRGITGTASCTPSDVYCAIRNVPAGEYLEVAVGEVHACALAVGGGVTCWGVVGDNDCTPEGAPGHFYCGQAVVPADLDL